jgi:enoyl-CoA hydratase/carnithine racemase
LAALDMIVTGLPISAEAAVKLGLADQIAPADVIEAAIALIRELTMEGNYIVKPVSDRDDMLAAIRQDSSDFERGGESVSVRGSSTSRQFGLRRHCKPVSAPASPVSRSRRLPVRKRNLLGGDRTAELVSYGGKRAAETSIARTTFR